MLLFVGLGNPGREYVGTRHNLGKEVLEEFARRCGIEFYEDKELQGLLGKGRWKGRDLLLLLPLTYMNRSGTSVRRCLTRERVFLEDLFVLSDDVALPLGEIRVRSQGSSGGHNGLKDVEAKLGTRFYSRLRLGVGAPRAHENLEDFVLAPFRAEEKESVTAMCELAVTVLEERVQHGIKAAMQRANRKCQSEGETRHVEGKKEPLRGDVHLKCNSQRRSASTCTREDHDRDHGKTRGDSQSL